MGNFGIVLEALDLNMGKVPKNMLRSFTHTDIAYGGGVGKRIKFLYSFTENGRLKTLSNEGTKYPNKNDFFYNAVYNCENP